MRGGWVGGESSWMPGYEVYAGANTTRRHNKLFSEFEIGI